MARKVLIVQTAFLGDVLLSIPLIKKVRKLWPDAEIDLVCRSRLGDFFIKQNLVERAFEVEKGRGRSYSNILEVIGPINYDLCICPHQSVRTALFVSRVRAKEKVGYKCWWNQFFFDKRIRRDLRLPDVLRQLMLLSFWDPSLSEKARDYTNDKNNLPIVSSEFLMQIEVAHSDFENSTVERLSETNFVLLAPGSQWPTKRWKAEGFVEIARVLKSQKLEVALVGAGPEDMAVNTKIENEVPGILNITGLTSLNQLATLMTKAEALICNDSGLMHLASAAGLPTVAIFGPTTLSLGYRPWQNQARVVEKELFCRPCGKHGHVRCPLGTHECMKSLSAGTVLTELKKVYKVLDQREPH